MSTAAKTISITIETNTIEPEVSNSTTQVDVVETFHESTQSDHAPVAQVNIEEILDEKLNRLAKALHVYSKYHDVTGKNLPTNVSFFGSSLLGLTSITGFNDTLLLSLRFINLYLNVSIF